MLLSTMMRATRLILVLTVFAATLTVRANDTPLLIELEPRTRLFPAGVSAAGAVLVGALAAFTGCRRQVSFQTAASRQRM